VFKFEFRKRLVAAEYAFGHDWNGNGGYDGRTYTKRASECFEWAAAKEQFGAVIHE